MSQSVMDEVSQRTNLALTNQMEMLTFYLSDSQQYGINVFKIIEVIETPDTVTHVPQAHEAIVGAINFRDSMVTAIDIGIGLGLKPVDYKNDVSYIIVCEYSGTTQGLLISQPNKLMNRSWEDIKTPTGNFHNAAYLTALTYDVNDEAIQILDVEKLLGDIIGIEDYVPEELIATAKSEAFDEYRLLVVDDSRAARMLLRSTLDKIGLKYTMVESALKGLDVLKAMIKNDEKVFDLIISDIEMPGMDGFTFTRKLKSSSKLSGIRLVLHSSMSNPSNRVKADQVGADGFIPKFQSDKVAEDVINQLRIVRDSRE
ncbi:MAG: chemotaxis protein CheV [Magnetococcales bacterium]|nr:chemotaxis protein CheV [Magnetococcales bacterium]